MGGTIADVDRASLQRLLAQGLSLAEIGRRFDVHESTVSYWIARHGLLAANHARHRSRGAIPREQLEALVQQGMTVAEIAAAVERSKSTVRHWLGRYGLRTAHKRGKRPSARALDAKQRGLVSVQMRCPRHGDAEFWLEGRGYYRCKQCRAEAVLRRRRTVKAALVSEAGGCCCICGYRRSMRALHFHHLDPSAKRFAINAQGMSLGLESLRAEARKCILLCSNCHAEVEDGIVPVAATTAHRQNPG